VAPAPPGTSLEDLLCRHANVLAHVDGHEHVNAVIRHPCTDAGQAPNPFWEVSTSAHIDWPQQSRMIELVNNGNASMSLVLTMLDHDGPAYPGAPGPDFLGAGNAGELPIRLASIAREIGYNDYQASRGAAGDKTDRNVIAVIPKPPPPVVAAAAGASAGASSGASSAQALDLAGLNRAGAFSATFPAGQAFPSGGGSELAASLVAAPLPTAGPASASASRRVVMATGRRVANRRGRSRLRVRLTRSGRALVRAALRRHRNVRATLSVRVTPRLGHRRRGRTATRIRRVTLSAPARRRRR
jgi:hypothetical protein